ncbi:hypothetical protein BJV82DRAFT_635602 [Fennellomyces sp. T-0311]|nr:hypothetical protein BJV82DRAFT_635602 [Fennellomyces sp. T-0311]
MHPDSDTGDAKRQGTQNTNSMVSAVNSGNAIEALKGRIIATHKLLRYLDTARKDLQNEKDRAAGLTDQLKQLEAEHDLVKQKLKNREMYAKQLEAAADDRANKKKTESVEVAKLKKDLAAMKQAKDSMQISYRSLQDENIKLKREREAWTKEREDFEEEKMEKSIDYEMLQNSLTEAKEEAATLQQKVADLQQELLKKSAIVPTQQPVAPSYHDNDLLAELQKYVEENRRLLNEKRVLQDRFTEQLVMNADMDKQLREASLGRFLPGASNVASSSQSLVLSPRTPASPKQQRTYPSVTSTVKSPPSAIVPSTPVAKASRLIAPAPQRITPAKKPQAPKTKLEKLAGMRLTGIQRKRANDESTVGPGRPAKRPSVPPAPTGIKDNAVNKLLKLAPGEAMAALPETAKIIAQHRLHDPNGTNMLFSSIALLLKELKSHSNPTSKGSGTNMDMGVYGVPGGIHVLSPNCIITPERNIAWVVYAYYSLHERELLHEFTGWAMTQALEFLKVSKTGLACRYIRLLAMVLRQANDKKRMHVFCYDVIRTTPLKDNAVFPMLNIALLWPDVLKLSAIATAGSEMVVKAIQSACVAYIQSTDENKANLQLTYQYFIQLCGWPAIHETVPLEKRIVEFTEVLLSGEFKQIASLKPDAFADLRFNLVKSFELVYYRLNNWESIYNVFVIQVLWPLMRDVQLADTCLELMAVVVHLGTLTKDFLAPRRGRHPQKENEQSADIEAIRQKFVQALNISNACLEDEFDLQVTSAKGLIMLASGDVNRVMPVIEWYQKIDCHFSKRLPLEFAKTLSKLTTVVRSTLVSTPSL